MIDVSAAVRPERPSRRPRRGTGRSGARGGVRALIARRLVQIPLVLLVVAVLSFWLIQIVPGNPGRNALGQYATEAQVEAWNAAHGFDGGVLERFVRWFGGFITGDWGESIVYAVPVRDLVLERLGASAVLGIYAFLIMVPLSILIGAVQAYRESSRVDRSITVLLMSLAAVPEFVIGVVLLILFSVGLGWFPIQSSAAALGGDALTRLNALTLPALVLALSHLAVLARMVRTGYAGVLAAPFHRTAVLKGVAPAVVATRHVARNALIPTISLLGVYLGALMSGNAVVETLFGYPGLGAVLVTATVKKDILLLEAGVMVTGLLSLLVLLATDLVFLLVDPRVRFEGVRS